MTLFKSYNDPYSITAVLSNVDIMNMRTPSSSAKEVRQARLTREPHGERLKLSSPASDSRSRTLASSA